MARRTIEISREPARLSARDGQLIIGRLDDDADEDRLHLANVENLRRRIPCEDIGIIVVDTSPGTGSGMNADTLYTHSALRELAEHGAALVVCDRRHLPAAIMLPLSTHHEQIWRLDDQIEARQRKPLIKQLWSAIVCAKIRAQASNLIVGSPARNRLDSFARRVRSGDPENLEAQAARAYWPALFAQGNQDSAPSPFRRQPGERSAPNSFLDYGYAILRAAVARSLVGAGLLPAIGIHHHNRSNSFCLADDLIEPLRPLVDRVVVRLHEMGQKTLDQPTKAELLAVLSQTVQMGSAEEVRTGPLDAALPLYAASLAKCFADRSPAIEIPMLVDAPRCHT